MSIEKPKAPGTSDPHIDTQMEQKELLRNALQESYEMNLINSDSLEGDIKRNIFKNIERSSKDKDISLDPRAFQIAYNSRLKEGDTYSASTVVELASNQEMQLTPDNETLQSGYEKLMEEAECGKAEEMEKIAQKKNIEITLNKDALQKGYDYIIENFYSYKFEKIEKFADKHGIKLEVKKESLQKAYDKTISELQFLNSLEKIEQLASKNGINLEINNELAKESYIKFVLKQSGMAYGEPESVVKEWLDSRNQFVDFLTKRGVDINIENKKIQELYEESIKKADDRSILVAQKFATEKGISLNADNINFQELYDRFIGKGNVVAAKTINKIALEHGLEINDSSKEKLQQVYDTLLASGSLRQLSEIQELGKENGVELEIKKDMLQRGYETVCTGDVEHIGLYTIDDIEEMAKENKIKLENAKELIEKTYIEAIHNVRLGHATHERNEVMEKLQKLGSNLTYEDVIKMDYLEHLGVPEERRLNMEKTVKIGNVPVTARFYGQKQETPVQGKFIIGITPGNNLEFVADSTLGEHKDIGGKYDLEIIGGGWLEIDEQNKKVKIYRRSQDFGYEPRSISKKVIADVFTEYEVIVEN